MSFGVIAIATTAVSTGVSMYGQYQAGKAQEQAAKWNADQQRKQASYEEGIAQRNMRRERENNRRELARRRASAARGGLAETGAVSDELIEASERHQTELDDIWERASTQSQVLKRKAAMSIWEGKQARAASQYNMISTGIGGVGSALTTAKDFGMIGNSPPKAIPVK